MPPCRVALYARYSSDNQRDASIEDELRQCRERAARGGWNVVETYSDHAVSGATLIRSGIQSLLADAQAGRFDMVLSAALDRISRDQEDVVGIFKRGLRRRPCPCRPSKGTTPALTRLRRALDDAVPGTRLKVGWRRARLVFIFGTTADEDDTSRCLPHTRTKPPQLSE